VFCGREIPWNWQSESWVKMGPEIGPLLAAEPPQQNYRYRG